MGGGAERLYPIWYFHLKNGIHPSMELSENELKINYQDSELKTETKTYTTFGLTIWNYPLQN